MDWYTFLPQLLNMSLTASVVILFVLLGRLALKRAPKIFSYALWAVVLLRLLCPVAVTSPLSLLGVLGAPVRETAPGTASIEYIPADIVHTEFPQVQLPLPGVSDAINGHLPQGREQLSADPLELPASLATYLWGIGALGLAGYSAVSYLKLRRRLAEAAPLRENIYLADGLPSPFVLGLFRPRIYLPSSLSETEQSYILLHEQHHIRRLDHIIKALSFLALCIHWFNPLVWAAFILSGRDMEMSCDEAVVKRLGGEIRADYSASLLTLSTGQRILAGIPLAFGEGDPKGRIQNLAHWKKPAFWVILAAAAACAVLAVCLLTNPAGQDGARPQGYYLRVGTDGVVDILVSTPHSSGGCRNADGSPRQKGEEVYLEQLDRISDLRGVTITALDASGEVLYSLSVPEDATDQEIVNLVAGDDWLLAPTKTQAPSGGEQGQAQASTLDQLPPGTAYVSWQCLYMNSLSSYLPVGGDSGYRYLFGENYFAAVGRKDEAVSFLRSLPALDTGDQAGTASYVEVPKWEWQEFPYTDEAWTALYWPDRPDGVENISGQYDEMLYQPLTKNTFLLLMDGDLWLVELADLCVGTCLWSIYSLVPESAMGAAQWEFAPVLSSRSPVFRFEFDMDYTEISAVCVDSPLVDFDSPGAPSDTSMTFAHGNALCWSPVGEDGATVPNAEIHFTVHDGDSAPYAGTIYLTGGGQSDGRRVYTASLAGTGLHLAPSAEAEGGVISPVSISTAGGADGPASVSSAPVEHDLRDGDLELTVGELGDYILFTNTEQIAVEVHGGAGFAGSLTLRDISQANAEIGVKEVSQGDNTALFTGLTSARLYRITCQGLEGCTLRISGAAPFWSKPFLPG